MRYLITIMFLLGMGLSFGQQADLYPYYPGQTVRETWKIRADVYGSEESNSNTITNEFFREVNGSGYIDPQLKGDQLAKMNGDILTGSLRSLGAGVFINSGRIFFYAGLEHQQVLDSRISSHLVKLLLQGNKPFAGATLEVEPSVYTNVYFNRLTGGVGYELRNKGTSHTFFGKVGLIGGQNFDRISVEHASLYTHPDGDYLNISVQSDTQISDTVWAGVSDINGTGMTFDLSYAFHREKDYYLGFSMKNLGFIHWNGNTFSASIDTTFIFEGVSMDTTSSANGSIPDDYSYRNLRRILFKNPDGSPFSQGTPVILAFSGGKYFSAAKFYAGINAFYFPTLEANYKLEVFGTWNHRSVLQLSPVVTFSAYNKVHFGLAAGLKLGQFFFIQAGSNYLDSFFISDTPAGRGGFMRLVFIR